MNRTKRNILSILAASVLLCGSAEAQVADYGRANGIISFEENTDPVLPGKGSQLSVCVQGTCKARKPVAPMVVEASGQSSVDPGRDSISA